MNSEEDVAAALVLCDMKNSKIDYQTSLQLKETNLFILKKHGLEHPSSPSPPHRSRLLSLVPPSLAGIIGHCSTPFEKQLTGHDLRTDQVRLLLKFNHVIKNLYPLLRPTEVNKIKKKQGIVVCVYDCNGRMYEMVFNLWGSKAHVITKKTWINFCHDHELVAFLDLVTIWMFRHIVTGRICFVITSERRCVQKVMEPVFDLPAVARKKRTKSCSSSSNSKRRRLDVISDLIH